MTIDRTKSYADAVVSGEIVAGPYVRGACKRHLDDLALSESGTDFPFYFDHTEAERAFMFFEGVLRLNGGQYEGKPFILFPWEAFVIGSIYGWKRVCDDNRRFRVAYIETPKGSGKSPIAAGVGLKGLLADSEPRAEIYAAATFKDQAMVLFRDAIAFYDQSPYLQSRLIASGTGAQRWNLAFPKGGSFFRVISSEKKGQSGPRPHVVLLDEIHEHRDGNVIEMLRAGFKFRRQPLSFMITNSGSDKTSVCWEYHDLGCKVARQQVKNDEFFSYICTLDEADLKDGRYLDDETLWPKVNPSLEYGIPGYDYIRGQVNEARGLPSKMATVKRLCFCVWTEAENPAIDRDAWFACEDKGFNDALLVGRRCWGGLDLAGVIDLAAFALMFEPTVDDPVWRLKVWFWVPNIGIVRKVEVDRVPYVEWRDNGHVNAIDRKTIDYGFMVVDIGKICRKYNVQKFGYDRWKIKDFEKERSKLEVELPEMEEFGQGYKSMSPAIQVFETKLIEGELRHDGNPCLTWNAANVVATEDPAKNRKYDKSRSTGRIDGIIATVIACGMLEETEPGSAYDGMSYKEVEDGIITI